LVFVLAENASIPEDPGGSELPRCFGRADKDLLADTHFGGRGQRADATVAASQGQDDDGQCPPGRLQRAAVLLHRQPGAGAHSLPLQTGGLEHAVS